MSLAPGEFIRRFLLHTIPSGFQRIRHYGLLASRGKKARLESCRALLDVVGLLPLPEQIAAAVRIEIDAAIRCPVCGIGEMASKRSRQTGRARPRRIAHDAAGFCCRFGAGWSAESGDAGGVLGLGSGSVRRASRHRIGYRSGCFKCASGPMGAMEEDPSAQRWSIDPAGPKTPRIVFPINPGLSKGI
jgi:hypothetical protein